MCWLILPPALVGCQTMAPATAAAPPVNLSGYPPNFREGYADGCNSAHGKAQQDAQRMKSDSLYAQGYRDGFDSCGRR
jgi:hypothetical protein